MDRKLAAAILSALLYAHGLLGFAALASALLHGHANGIAVARHMTAGTGVPAATAGRAPPAWG